MAYLAGSTGLLIKGFVAGVVFVFLFKNDRQHISVPSKDAGTYIGVKALCRLHISMFIKLCGCRTAALVVHTGRICWRGGNRRIMSLKLA